MRTKLAAVAWGFGGALAALVVWWLAATAYTDHVLLREVVTALNAAATRQAQSQPAPVPAK
jgi:hypothetical protein